MMIADRLSRLCSGLRSCIGDMSRVIFPVTCEVCGCTLVEGEKVLCLDCRSRMPRVNAHVGDTHPLALKLAAAAKVRMVASMFVYVRDTPYARMIQRSKYNSRPEIDRYLATMFSAELMQAGFFSGIDVVLPVPMHYVKKLRRGYNQAEEIALGVGEVTGIEVSDNLVARRAHDTQTRKSAVERLRNAEGVYDVAYPDELAGKHVLLVDDVITTGATVMACAEALRKAVPSVTVSVLTLAATRLA